MNDRLKYRIHYLGKMVYPDSHKDTDTIYECLKQQVRWDSDIDTDMKFDHIANDLTFMQCTGLKDKHNKLIYEGDILGGSYEPLYVHYCNKCKQFQLKAKKYGCMACEGDIHWYEVTEDDGKLEVIGNIYENKELLDY